MRHLAIPALLLSSLLNAQIHDSAFAGGGAVSVGVRSAFSFFNDGQWSDVGQGMGGQVRVQLSDRVNTDWYFDFLSGTIGNYGHRKDLHIGWSVLYYPLDPATTLHVKPFILAGHCFDNSQQFSNADPNIHAERWSSAVQAGIGTHLLVGTRSDVSLVAQYMIHLGTDIHAHAEGGVESFEKEQGVSLEGHLLVHISYNYTLFHAW